MNYDDILALVRAGYSKTEIDAMGSGAAAPAPVPEPAPAPAPKLAPATAPEPAPATAPEPAPAPAPQLSQTEALLRKILGAVQMGNINKATTEPPVEEGADVVTARIINPNYGKEK